ncbi:tRNA (adenosine(37)-N6)-threonylcarbamoyltransferase complex transferase subunit TsaD [Candidatus Nomurabacteria bacterium]|nr:tRNA (adenosine(37)-N6)-threonylcarbamoyltransferase complex transferase subunit TsaD [Candidatus Nomurabacteria bacterium]
MKILSIETSCDDTGIAILETKGGEKNLTFKVLAEGISSQIKIHAEYGGVFPALAKREHIKNLPILLNKVLKKGKLKSLEGINLIAVTYGPGLEPALWTGIVFAKELAKKCNVPLMPVNHMEGHILSVFGKNKGEFKIPKTNFPILSLLVSGGHTELVLAKDWMKYKVIGETLDDAAGEAFDKVARMLGLPYPGGPEISRLAELGRTLLLQQSPAFTLPRPMMYSKNFDFSFSGLKTAVLYLIRKIGTLDEEIKMKIALEFENAVVETLIHKTKKALTLHKAGTLIVAGGVSANKYLRKEIMKLKKDNPKLEILFPEKKLSTDNAIMIGIVSYLKYIKNNKKVPNPAKIKAVGNLSL